MKIFHAAEGMARRRNLFGINTSTALFAIDQQCKAYVEDELKVQEEKEICEHLTLRRVHNPGFSMGVLAEKNAVVRCSSLISAALISVCRAVPDLLHKGNRIEKAGLTLSAAGAWSNTYDRLNRKYVVDYIGIRTGNKERDKLTFNLGDFYLLGGALLTVVGSILPDRKPKKKTGIGAVKERLRKY